MIDVKAKSFGKGRRADVLQGAFTLVEMMVVVAVIAILASLLLPAIAKSKSKALRIKCVSNLRQVGQAFILYADDHKGQLTPLNSGGPWGSTIVPHNPTNWWYQILTDGHYMPETNDVHGIWRCPEARGDDLNSPFGKRMDGYGPLEGKSYIPGLPSIIDYAYRMDGTKRGSHFLSEIKRPSQLWLVGDVGVPKDLKNIPKGGYRTDITTFAPDASGDYPHVTPKQPAARHDGKANVCFVDTHVEAWSYDDLRFNKGDIWGLKAK
jgi:prepilin-type N-terminal cleavage/methylation domain-containing protein/prepilin-type processing-associated H-X9-DG protein